MVAQFKTGSRVAPLVPLPLLNANIKCNTVFLRTHIDNTNNIYIGSSNQLAAIIEPAPATISINTEDGQLILSAAIGGSGANGKTLSFVLDDATDANTPTANENDLGVVITVNSTVNTSLSDINTATHALNTWNSSVENEGVFNPGDFAVNATYANGINLVAATATITFEDGGAFVFRDYRGTSSNKIKFELDSNTSEEAPTILWDGTNSTYIITVNSTANTSVTNIVNCIEVSEYTIVNATLTQAGVFNPTCDSTVNATVTNGINLSLNRATLNFLDGGCLKLSGGPKSLVDVWGREVGDKAFYNGKTIQMELSTSVNANTPQVLWDDTTGMTMLVNASNPTNLTALAAAVDSLNTQYNPDVDTPGSFDPKDAGIIVESEGGSEGSFLGCILPKDTEIEIPVEYLNDIYIYSDTDRQVISWLAKGV
jgi:hypothetical protein